jgi:hypothetical protein
MSAAIDSRKVITLVNFSVSERDYPLQEHVLSKRKLIIEKG